MQSVYITTKVVSSNPAHGDVYLQHYVIKFVSDFDRSVVFSGFSCFFRHNITKISLKVALNTMGSAVELVIKLII